MKSLKLSIITINYNNAEGLKSTILSVINQTYINLEYIIIDGGSTDDSVEIIKKYSDKINYWVSEPDKGIYHAMNKGIHISTGDYLLMLNSGDKLKDDIIIKTIFDYKLTEDIIYGDVKWETNGEVYQIRTFPEKLSFQFFWKGSLGHQSCLIKKSVHDIVGLYDDKLKIVSDWKLFILAICKYNFSYKYLPFIISTCDTHGVSWNGKNFAQAYLEKQEVLENYFPLFTEDYFLYNKLKNNTLKNKLSHAKHYLKGKVKRILLIEIKKT